jgi:hypothetical protein
MTAPIIGPNFDCAISFDESVPCLIMAWKGYATSRQFRDSNEKVLDALRERRVSSLLADVREFILIGAADQQWLTEDWIPRATAVGLRRVAMIAPDFYFNRVAVDTVARQLNPDAVAFRYFSDREAATLWLSS